MRKSLVTSLSGTWPKAGVKLGVGRGGDTEKCQISMAWEHAGGELESGAHNEKSSNPKAQLLMEKICELLGRAGSGKNLELHWRAGWDGQTERSWEGQDGQNWVNIPGVSAPRKATGRARQGWHQERERGVQVLKQVRAREKKKQVKYQAAFSH